MVFAQLKPFKSDIKRHEFPFAGFLFASHLAAPWFPQSPGCNSSFLSPRCSEDAGALSPAGPSPRLLHGSSPAALDSSSPAGSLTWPSPCGSFSVLPPCLTRHAGGRWPLPASIWNRQNQKKGAWRLMHHPSCHSDYECVCTAYLILQLHDFVIAGLWILADLLHLFKLLF